MANRNKRSVYTIKPGTYQPVGPRPVVSVRQDKPVNRPAGTSTSTTSSNTGTFTQPALGPDVSWQDSIYNQGQTNIQTGLNNLGAYLLNQGKGIGLEYGVDVGDADPTKYDPAHPPGFKIDWEKVDVTNPFSRAALLKRSHQAVERGNTNSMAARGQLYSGALQNAKDQEAFNFLGGQNQLTGEFASKWGGLYGQWLAAKQAGDQQALDNIAAAVARHENDPATGTGFNTGGAAAPGTNPNQYADQPTDRKQPKEIVDPAVARYLEKQKKGKLRKPKHPKYGNTGGSRAPGR